MTIRPLLRRLDLKAATDAELGARTRLLPGLRAEQALSAHTDQVADLLRASISQAPDGARATVLFAAKQRGARPLNLWRLQDRVLYRALANYLRSQLPAGSGDRVEHSAFERAPLDTPDARYITATDISSYYVYVDHAILGDELIAQTGDYDTVTSTLRLLGQVMSGSVGLPQVHDSSDLLGDVYIDPIRRKLIRSGYPTETYSDDFRICATTLGGARKSLEMCAASARELGLVLNEAKTFTYAREHYESSLEKFKVESRKVVEDNGLLSVAKFLFHGRYDDDVSNSVEPESDSETTESVSANSGHPDPEEIRAVWKLWSESTRDDLQKNPMVRQLLGQSLPELGVLGEISPLDSIEDLVRSTPELTPKVSEYLCQIARSHPDSRPVVAGKIVEALDSETCSRWQTVWLLHSSGTIGLEDQKLTARLSQVLESGDSVLTAYAAEALGQLGTVPAQKIAEGIDFVTPALKGSVVWAVGQIEPTLAEDVADSNLERLLITERSE
ncbi:hypothetical protein TSST111916_16180 [Tsukamurella strandjordii]